MYRMIHQTAYEPDPANGPWRERYRVIGFPEEWRTEFLELYRRRWRSAPALPISRLNALLRATAPGLVATGRGADRDAGNAWFYATEELPAELVAPLLASWVMTLAPGRDADPVRAAGHRAATDRALALIEERTPRWTEEAVDLTAATASPGGTAEPDRRLYHLLPEQAGIRLAARPLVMDGVELRFRLVTREQGVELVSWPPRSYKRGKRTWFYSALVTLTVQTVPFATGFRLNASYGVRRWATGSPVSPSWDRGATVLLDAPLPWPDLTGPRHRLAVNSMVHDRRLGTLGWSRRSLVELLPELDIQHVYPKPAELAAEAEAWLGGRGDVAAGILHGNAFGPHGVGAGLMPMERALLDEWVEDGLRPYLRRVTALERVHRRSKPRLLAASSTKDPVKLADRGRNRTQARRAAVQAVLEGEPLTVDVLWQTEETRDALSGALCEWLGLEPPEEPGESHEWAVPGLRVVLRATPIGALAGALPVRREGRRTDARAIAAATRERAVRTLAALGLATGRPGLALVEIMDPDSYPVPGTDPKPALRLGCAKAGRVSQFIVMPERADGPLPARARSVLADGMRQLGTVVPPEQNLDEELADDFQYLALWHVHQQAAGHTRYGGRQLVALRIRPRDQEHPVRGWDEAAKEWVPYSRLLLTTAATHAETGPGDGASRGSSDPVTPGTDVERQIRALLYQVRDRPTLLLANSGNLRSVWPGLANGRLVRDRLVFEGEEPARLSLYGPDLRVVLLRDANSREETPQWYAPGESEDDVPGVSIGLWAPEDASPDQRVFTSTVGKPPTAGGVRKDLRKLVPTVGWPHAPAASAWNPQAVELTVLGCSTERELAESGRADRTPDQPRLLAAAVHQLRFHDEYHPLSRPLPLHLAKLVEEYVIALAPELEPAGAPAPPPVRGEPAR
ncbi:pPIWI_RE module domain-containing protein [Kitasatospora saccharophila]|uniref:pPIWI_RE module domain-containing protein n=1 Tax=Kitasatospora saccharophila TaxID=407973 RepID=UPI00362DD092